MTQFDIFKGIKLKKKINFIPGNNVVSDGRNVTAQCISGTGALRVGATFLAKWFPGNKTIYLPKPSWGNHTPIFKHAGVNVEGYRYQRTIFLHTRQFLVDVS